MKDFCRKIGKICLLSLTFFVNLGIFTGCDTCPGTGPGGGNTNGIYFTAGPLGVTKPYVFGVNPDGRNYREIFKNGLIYSAPSDENIGVILSRDSLNRAMVIRFNFSTKAAVDTPHLENDFFSAPDFAIKQPTGRNFLVNASDTLVFYNRNNGQEVFTIRENFLSGTMPEFSPNGDNIAYYYGTKMDADAQVVVWNPAAGTGSQYPGLLKQPFGTPEISWSQDNSLVIYTVTESDTMNLIIVKNIKDGTGQSYKVYNNGGYLPALNSQGDSLAYVDKKGNIWVMRIPAAGEKPQQWKKTDADPDETCLYPKWSKDGKYLLYTRFYDGNYDGGGRLELLNLEDGTKSVLANNVFRGFENNN